ncbi:MAG: beta-lactamase family protein [Candidatus Eisenbacteria bacterium]|nr:beta-lactamase family protein [Candidatus Eisenbacteria bacterium]
MRQAARAWCHVAGMLLFVVVSASAAPGALEWPGTPLAQHARAWFAMLTADDAAARAFFAEHVTSPPQAPVSVDERMQRRAAVIERTGGLTPLEVVDDDVTRLAVRCSAGNGDRVVAVFEAEAVAPHRIMGVRLEALPPGEGGGPPPRDAGPPLDGAAAVKQAKALLDSRAATGAWSGAALIARGGEVLVSGAWGDADRSRKIPNTAATRFNVGSIGKVFTRTAIAQLAEAGKLSLDDRLSKYLPDFPHADSITLAMLCAHRSGVGDFFNGAYDALDKKKLAHNRDYLPLFRDQPLWFAPGTSQRYSNGGYVLLGEVIAKVSGEDYYDYLAKHVFGPAGMRSTAALVEGDGTKGVARGYTTEGAAQGERDNVATRPARGSAAGGSYSTLADLLALDRALIGGKLCGKAWASWVTGGPRPVAGAAPAPAEMPSFGMAGGAPGLNAEWLHEGDVVMIVLTNRDPETARPTVEGVQDIVRRMKPGVNRSRS